MQRKFHAQQYGWEKGVTFGLHKLKFLKYKYLTIIIILVLPALISSVWLVEGSNKNVIFFLSGIVVGVFLIIFSWKFQEMST